MIRFKRVEGWVRSIIEHPVSPTSDKKRDERSFVTEKHACPSCQRHISGKELEETFFVCPHCSHHFRLTAWERIRYTADEGVFQEFSADIETLNPLGFPEYEAKLAAATKKTGLKEAVVTGLCKIDGKDVELSPASGEGDDVNWFASQELVLAEGNHALMTGYTDPMTPHRVRLVEIAPARKPAHEPNPAPTIAFRQVNPARYIVNVRNATAPYFLVFAETFDDGWNAYLLSRPSVQPSWYEQSALLAGLIDGGNRVELSEHALVNGYANSWHVDKTGDYDILLEFVPQRLYEGGLLVSLATLVGCGVFLVAGRMPRRVRSFNDDPAADA